MKAQVLTLTGSVAHEIELPPVFSSEFRPDLIKKAVIAQQSRRYQPHGAYVYAGISASAVGWGSGRGVSHVPRLKNSSRAAKVPQAKGGREAHPPKVEKVLIRSINQKEKRKALNSAIAATISPELVRSRGHVFTGSLPFVLSGDFESLKKTKEVIEALRALVFTGMLSVQNAPERFVQVVESSVAAGINSERVFLSLPEMSGSVQQEILPEWMCALLTT